MNRKRWIILACVTLVVLSTIPRNTDLVPQYQVAVMNDAGKPLPGLKVIQFIQDYSYGSDSERTLERQSDANGKAEFPSYQRSISPARQILGCLIQIVSTGAHASFGVYSDIGVNPDHFVESARKEEPIAGNAPSRFLRITLTACPSNDWFSCTQALHATTPVDPRHHP